MLPFTAYAVDYTIEFTESNNVKANDTGSGSISATSSDCHGTSGTHAEFTSSSFGVTLQELQDDWNCTFDTRPLIYAIGTGHRYDICCPETISGGAKKYKCLDDGCDKTIMKVPKEIL